MEERILPGRRKFLEEIWVEMEENKKEIEGVYKGDKGIM